jgi:hypothetical protein
MKPASLYNHVSGIDEVRLRLACYALEKMEAAIRDTAVGYSREEALRKIAYAYRHFGSTHPELYRAFINSANIEDKRIEEAKQSVVRIFYQVLEPYANEKERRFCGFHAGRICLYCRGGKLEGRRLYRAFIDQCEQSRRSKNYAP